MWLTRGRLVGPAGASGPVDLHLANGMIAGIRQSVTPPPGQSGAGAGSAADTWDLDGRFVLPGLWDHHVHFDQWSQASRRIDLAPTSSAAGLAQLVAARLDDQGLPHASDPADQPVVGYGFRDGLWPDAPSRAVLDAATGDRVAVMISGDLHSAWLNSAALARFGHPDHPTGLLREAAAMTVLGRLSAVEEAVGDRWADDAARAAATRGVVGIVDLEKPWSAAAWARRIAGGSTSLRIRAGVWPDRLDEAIDTGLRTGDLFDAAGGLLGMGPFKVITDGSLNTRTAYCHDRYPALADDQHPFGQLVVPPEQLLALMRRATAAGLSCAVHAIGDHANALALQAFAESGAHGSIEHAQLLDDADVPRFAELGVVASVQPEHAMDDRDVAERHWAGRTGRAFVLRSLLDVGARLALGSDAPVAPLDPWITISAAVTRSRDGRPAWHPEQSITVAQALAASYAPGRGGHPLRAGEPADLVIVEEDPVRCPADALRRMPVAGTVLAGRWTHHADR